VLQPLRNDTLQLYITVLKQGKPISARYYMIEELIVDLWTKKADCYQINLTHVTRNKTKR